MVPKLTVLLLQWEDSYTDTPKSSVHLIVSRAAWELSIAFSTPGQVEHLPDFVVEFAGVVQFLKGEVHAVAPVVV